MKAIIVDDEKHSINSLRNDLRDWCPHLELSASFISAREALIFLSDNSPDIIFLDIEMPEMNGFDFLSNASALGSFQFIFITAYDRFALKAFKARALDYLLKPIDPRDLMEAVAQAHLRISQIREKRGPKKISLPIRDGYEFISISGISHCTAEGAYTNIVLTDGNEKIISKSIGEIEELLDNQYFLRIHHSTLVNRNLIKAIRRSKGLKVVMENGLILPVARSRKDYLMEALKIK